MAGGSREKIMLLSTGKNKDGEDTGYFYTTVNKGEKIELMKFDPWAWNEATNRYGKHVPFKEKKIPK